MTPGVRHLLHLLDVCGEIRLRSVYLVEGNIVTPEDVEWLIRHGSVRVDGDGLVRVER